MMQVMIAFSGGCACGETRYRSSVAPVLVLNCHCRDCQRSSGGPFSSFAIVPAEAFTLEGPLRFHATQSGLGGQTHRAFCSQCGSPIHVRQDANPDIVAIRTASVDDPSLLGATLNVWTSDAQPWDHVDPALPQFETYPTAAPQA